MGNWERSSIKIFLVLFMVIFLISGSEVIVSAETKILDESSIEVISAAEADISENPVHNTDNDHYTNWSYVYFGSYPQTEVTENALTEDVIEANYDSNGDAWVNGIKYRRICIEDTNNDAYFGDSEYRYFKWESIRWRILQKDGDKLFVMADLGLDCKAYNEISTSTFITWENCTLRTWLNQIFYNTAFDDSEQEMIVEHTVVNEAAYGYGTTGGNNTQDKVYLLSVNEMADSSYGFCTTVGLGAYCPGRWVQASEYAHAMGGYTESDSQTGYNETCYWWLRSPGMMNFAAAVHSYGHINNGGSPVNNTDVAVVPAMQIDLSAGIQIPILISPRSQIAEEGEAVSFSVRVSGWETSDCTYQWYYALSQSGEGVKIDGAVSSDYVIPDANEETGGKYYYCIVSRGADKAVSGRAKLSIYAPPILSSLTSQSVNEGDSVSFRVSVSGGVPSRYTYQWYYSSSQNGTGTEIAGASQSYYTLSSGYMTSALNGRYYYCVVSNGKYTVTSDRAKLTVYSAPNVTSPISKSVKVGTGAVFSVTASGGNPTNYTYQWYYAISSTGTGTRISGAVSASYAITSGNMTASLNGKYYYCVVSNGQCGVTSNRAKLTVYSAPNVISPTSIRVKAGTSATFSVSVSGGNPTSYTCQWYYAASDAGIGTKINGATSASYTIPAGDVTTSINGRYYYCVVSNGQYEVTSNRASLVIESSISFETNSAPGGNGSAISVQTIQASSYTKEYGSKAFFIQATTNGNGKLTYQSSNKKVAAVSANGQVKLKGCGTAVITIHASQTSAYKAASKKITIEVIPKKTALKKVSSPGNRRISMKWKKNKKASGYEIYISPNKKFKSQTYKRTYPKAKTSTVLIGLQSGKKYYVKIRSYAKVGKKKYYSNWSKVKQVKIK